MQAAATAIHTARTRARLSQSALSRRAGVAQSTVSRIERGELDPTWVTMQKLLDAAGWAAHPVRTAAADLITAPTVASAMAQHLRRGDTESAIRDLTEAIGRLIRFSEAGRHPVPAWVVTEPSRAMLDCLWHTYLATAFAYALERAGEPIPAWMLNAPPLEHETVVGDDPTPEVRSWLRKQTPAIFLRKNILSRPDDWSIA